MDATSLKHVVNKIHNYVLLITTCLLVFLLAEVTFRIVAYRSDLKSLDSRWEAKRRPLPPGEEAHLGDIIHLNQNPRIIYELIPGINVTFMGQPVSINSEGFRGPSIPLEKRDRTIRIVGIGDSVMFGWGVKEEETYMALLSTALNETYSPYSWEVVNTAVPGYNTVMEVESLADKGIHYHPDIVIIHYVGNDLYPPNFINFGRKRKRYYFSMRTSFVMQFLESRQWRLGTRTPHDSETRTGFEGKPKGVPEEYKDLVGQDAFYGAMRKLQSLSKENGFEVLVLFRRAPAFVQDICSELGFDTIDAGPAWSEYIRKHRTDGASVLHVSKEDPHPSAIGHKVIADTVLDFLKDSEYVQSVTREKN